MRVLFCVFRMSIHWRGPLLPPHATDSTFTFYFKYFLRILCTFYLSTFCLQYFLLLLKSFYCTVTGYNLGKPTFLCNASYIFISFNV
jgi:hypothetical protein